MSSVTPLIPPCSPPSFDVEPSKIVEDARKLVQTVTSVVDLIANEKQVNITFENTLLRFIYVENSYLRAAKPIQFYKSTHPEQAIREASETASKLLADAEVDLFMRKDFYDVFSAVQQNGEQLDPEYQYYLTKLQETFEQNGLSISGIDHTDQFRKILKRVKALQVEAQRNLNGDSTGLYFSPDELEGLPASFLEKRKESAVDEKPPNSKIWVTTKNPDAVPVMEFARNPHTRRRMFLAIQETSPGNVSVYRELFALRDEAARLLGFPNHAAFRTHYKIARNPETVLSFLSDLEARLKSRRDEYLAILLKFKENDPEALDVKAFIPMGLFVAEYFSLDRSIHKLFETFENMFGIRVRAFTPEPAFVWHTDVQMYTVWDESDGSFLGWLYIDPYPRDGKYSHFGYYNLQPGHINLDGDRVYPASVLVMNFPRPTAHKPTLLLHSQLKRLFHELGHAMHGLLSKTKVARCHGPPSNDRDFAEAVGIMFEHFMWTPTQMLELSLHYAYLSNEYMESWKAEHPDSALPSRHISEELVDRITSARSIGNELPHLFNIWRSKFDMAIYTPRTHRESQTLDLQTLFNQLRFETTGLAGPEVQTGSFAWGNGYAGFRGVGGAYDAGYYAYVLSQVYASDLFNSGFKGSERDPGRGRRYRSVVLEAGGSKPPMAILREFLGREPDDRAFREELGI